jgi:hypothetical protein
MNSNVVVTITGTALPLRTGGVNSHCMTASKAACLSNGGPSTTLALMTRPSGLDTHVERDDILDAGRMSDRWIGDCNVLYFQRAIDLVSESNSPLRPVVRQGRTSPTRPRSSSVTRSATMIGGARKGVWAVTGFPGTSTFGTPLNPLNLRNRPLSPFVSQLHRRLLIDHQRLHELMRRSRARHVHADGEHASRAALQLDDVL